MEQPAASSLVTADRPRAGARFFKGHGLGNDYLVFPFGDGWAASPEAVRVVCDRWRGVGADGVVLHSPPEERPWRLRMFNPDGSEFERSGNGLRVFAAYAASRGWIAGEGFARGGRGRPHPHAREGTPERWALRRLRRDGPRVAWTRPMRGSPRGGKVSRCRTRPTGTLDCHAGERRQSALRGVHRRLVGCIPFASRPFFDRP